MEVPLSHHHAERGMSRKGSQPLSLFMQRELSAIQFQRPNTVSGGEGLYGLSKSLAGKGWAGQSAGFGGPKTLGVTPYEAKLKRHYELKDTPACVSRTLAHQHRRRSHFQGSTMLLDARQASAAATTLGSDANAGMTLEELNERARENLRELEAEQTALAGLDQRYGNKYADMDTADHFKGGSINLTDEAEWSTRLHPNAKDRYGSESINDRAVSYDLVYGAEHEGKDTES